MMTDKPNKSASKLFVTAKKGAVKKQPKKSEIH